MPILPYLSRDEASDLPPLPPLLLALLAPWLDPLLAWLSTQVYRLVLAHCQGRRRIDPESPIYF